MRRAWLVACLLLSCRPTLFGKSSDIPSGLRCGDDGSCPPDQECVASEHVCRYPCDAPRPNCANSPMAGSADCGCPSGKGGQLVCDADRYCRLSCMSPQDPGASDLGASPQCLGSAMTSNGGDCGAGAFCDGVFGVCRALCADAIACPTGWSCGSAQSGVCTGCLPPGDVGGTIDAGDNNSDLSSGFHTASTGATGTLFSVRGTGNTDDVWAVGTAGTVTHLQGTAWMLQNPTGPDDLNDVWIDPASGFVVTVGRNGSASHRMSAGPWTTLSISSGDLNGVHGTTMSNVWAVGSGGKIFFFDGNTWTAQTSGVGADLYRVFAISTNEVYAVGANGTVLQTLNGGMTWTPRTAPPGTATVTLRALWAFADGITLWVAGDNGAIFRSMDSGQTWTDVHDTSGATGMNQLNDIWAGTESDVWVVGGNGLLLHSTSGGSDWQHEVIGGDRLHSIYGVAGDGVAPEVLFIAGDNGDMFFGAPSF